jgi:hypothetical protein
MLPVVLYGCETWSLTLREELRLRVFGNGVLRRIFWPERDEETVYGLDGPGIESRWGRDSFAHVQNGPGAHTASCTMGTVSSPRVKRPGRGADLPPTSNPEV